MVIFAYLIERVNVNRVPLQTFRNINPILIAVVTCDVSVIKSRLEERDSRTYDYNILEQMQNAEVVYAKEVAAELNVPYIESSKGDHQSIVEKLKLLIK